jgi:hypothetical protein
MFDIIFRLSQNCFFSLRFEIYFDTVFFSFGTQKVKCGDRYVLFYLVLLRVNGVCYAARVLIEVKRNYNIFVCRLVVFQKIFQIFLLPTKHP